MTDETHGDPYP